MDPSSLTLWKTSKQRGEWASDEEVGKSSSVQLGCREEGGKGPSVQWDGRGKTEVRAHL